MKVDSIEKLVAVFTQLGANWPFKMGDYHCENGMIIHMTKPTFQARLMSNEKLSEIRLLCACKDNTRDQDENIRTANSLSSRYSDLNIWSDGEGIYVRKVITLADHMFTNATLIDLNVFMGAIGEIRNDYYYVWTGRDRFQFNSVNTSETGELSEQVQYIKEEDAYTVGAILPSLTEWPKLTRRVAPELADILDKEGGA